MIYITMVAIGGALGLMNDIIVDPEENDLRTPQRVLFGAWVGLVTCYIVIQITTGG